MHLEGFFPPHLHINESTSKQTLQTLQMNCSSLCLRQLLSACRAHTGWAPRSASHACEVKETVTPIHLLQKLQNRFAIGLGTAMKGREERDRFSHTEELDLTLRITYTKTRCQHFIIAIIAKGIQDRAHLHCTESKD